jgi:thioredoxin-like negative regulator of GroEL
MTNNQKPDTNPDPKAPPTKTGVPPGKAPATAPGSVPPARIKLPPLFRKIDWIAFGLTALLSFIGYWLTLAPQVTLEDSGELAVASMYAGVPHPPGYPVWTIYTWLFTVLFPVSNIAYRVGMSSAFAGALGCGIVGMLVSRGSSMMIEGIAELKGIDRKLENVLCIVAGFVAGMLLAFNGFMWSQAVIVEVYTLSVLSLAGVLVCLLRWIYAPHQRWYLYLAFFWFGICFNNHQSLLVIALGLEVAAIAVSPKLGRALLLWNTIVFLGGLLGKSIGMVNVLSDNPPLLIIYYLIGIASAVGWIALVVKTRQTGMEIARDFALVASIGYIIALLLCITNYVTLFEYKTGLFVLFNLVGLGIIGVFIWLWSVTRHGGTEWAAALACGGAWMVGAAFYLYMPLAGMTNPPLNWGYPRTVTGFFHAFTRGQYERIHPTTSPVAFAKQIVMYFEGAVEEFNFFYLILALVPILFYKRLQKRERAWAVGLGSTYLCLSIFLLILLNPASDRQSRDLNKVFFTASHVIIAMAAGYGLTLIGSFLSTHYAAMRRWTFSRPTISVAAGVLVLGALNFAAADGPALFQNIITTFDVLLAIAVFYGIFAVRDDLEKTLGIIGSFPVVASAIALCGVYGAFKSANPLVHNTAILSLLLAAAAVVVFAMGKERIKMTAVLAIFALMPIWSIMSHWEDNEQRGHYFGYWFGHDMFTPPFKAPDGKLSYNKKLRDELLKTPEGKLIYPEMDPNTVLFGGTDPGRFNPTYMIFCESFIPGNKKPEDPVFDRRDVYLITQNALADGTYLNYIRAHYNRSTQNDPPFFQELLRGPRELEQNYETNFIARMFIPVDRYFTRLGAKIEARRRAEGVYPPKEINTPSNDDSQRAFQEYLADAQRRLDHDKRFPNEPRQIKPGEDVRIVDQKVQVSGQVAVMAINGLLTKVIFDKNPDHEFYVEESFPLDWMYPYLTPYGIIMKINRQPLAELNDDIVQRDHKFWSDYSERLVGNWITYDTSVSNLCAFAETVYHRRDYSKFKGDPRFVRDNDAQKAFSKLRSSIAGVYSWRLGNSKSPQEQQRMIKEAEFAFKQAYAFCPYSPEAVFRYINLLISLGRVNDAYLIAVTSRKLDPNNPQMDNLVGELERIKRGAPPGAAMTPSAPAPAAANPAQVAADIQVLEQQWATQPTNFQTGSHLVMSLLQAQQYPRALEVLDQILKNPKAGQNEMIFVAQVCNEMNRLDKVEVALDRLVRMAPNSPEAWFDLAGVQAVLNHSTQAVASLEESLKQNSQRRKQQPTAPDLLTNALVDEKLNPIRQLPGFQHVITQYASAK